MANLSNTVNSAGNSLNSTAEKAKSALNSGLANIDMDQVNHLKDEAMDKAAAFYEQSEKYVRQNPFYFIGGAAILGYLLGSVFTRKQ